MERRLAAGNINGSDAMPRRPKSARDYRTLRATVIAVGERNARQRVEAAGPSLVAVDQSFDFGELHDLIEWAKPYPRFHAALLESLDDTELEKYSTGLRGLSEKEEKGK